MAKRKRSGRCRKPGEIEIGGKCYKLYLVAAMSEIKKGADCSFARTNIVIDVADELDGLFAKKGKAGGSKKKK